MARRSLGSAAASSLLVPALTVGIGCADITLDPAPPIVHARFDPDAKVIPMPTDVLRDQSAGMLDLPVDDEDLSDAEREFYTYLETLDGWSSLMSATVEFTAPIDADSITDDNLQVWRWDGVPERITGARIHIAEDEQKITIDPPRTGWERGGRYFVVLRGGVGGAEGKDGQLLECDAAFYFLRQTERLDTPEHERAFPGATRAERQDNARKLETIRADLAPIFDWLEARGTKRTDVAALWAFTVTKRTELAMDKASQRMPLPIGLLIDPATGKVDLPEAPWDSEVERHAKHRLREMDGFSTSANLLFEFTAPMDAATVTPATVKLYRLPEGGGAPVLVPADVKLMKDLQHVMITPRSLPLPEESQFAVVVTRGVRDAEGEAVVAMPVGHFLKSRAPVFENGASEVGAVDRADAEKVELSRVALAGALDQLGREDILAAWPYHTMAITRPLFDVKNSAERLAIDSRPTVVEKMTPGEALADFALAISSLINVDKVIYGTLPSPFFLDERTRSWNEDGSYVVEDVAFAMTVPKNLPPGPVPVVIFGHGIVTDRRFVLAIGDFLANQGFVAISIDFPYHGTRTKCLEGAALIAVVDPTTGELSHMPPCANGTTCNAEGRCVNAAGQGNELAMFPVVNMPVASGAAFLEIEGIANTKDHFKQAVIDLGSLERSLRQADWSAVIGRPVDTTKIYYAGQSLGGIIGATYLAAAPDIKRAVLNVPGADLVDLFDDSGVFGAQVDGFFTRQQIERDSFEGERFLNVARWFVDAVDPQNLGPLTGDRELLIQMATLDFIIPNWTTEKLEEITGAPRRDYLAEHAFLVIPIEPECARGGNDMAAFLAGELQP